MKHLGKIIVFLCFALMAQPVYAACVNTIQTCKTWDANHICIKWGDPVDCSACVVGPANIPIVAGGPSTGDSIIDTVFNSINNVMHSIAQNFYNGIINNPQFKAVVNAVVILYITIYGVLIMFNLAPYRGGEVMGRLVRIAIIYAVVSPGTGWTFFYDHVGTLFIGGMNQLIAQFSAASLGGTAQHINTAPVLDSSAMSALVAPISKVFRRNF